MLTENALKVDTNFFYEYKICSQQSCDMFWYNFIYTNAYRNFMNTKWIQHIYAHSSDTTSYEYQMNTKMLTETISTVLIQKHQKNKYQHEFKVLIHTWMQKWIQKSLYRVLIHGRGIKFDLTDRWKHVSEGMSSRSANSFDVWSSSHVTRDELKKWTIEALQDLAIQAWT